MTPLSRGRRLVVIGAPLALIVFSLTHGLDWLVMHGMHEDYDAFIQYIVDIRVRWLAVHVVGLALFPLVGLAVWWMLPPAGIASRISRAGLVLYIVLYAAFDAIAGIGSAIVADYRTGVPADDHPVVDGIMWSLLGEADATFYLAEVASYAWLIGTGAAAVALWLDKGWRVALPLALGGLAMWHSHFPPFGAIDRCDGLDRRVAIPQICDSGRAASRGDALAFEGCRSAARFHSLDGSFIQTDPFPSHRQMTR